MHPPILGQGLDDSAVGLGCIGVSQSYGLNPGSREHVVATVIRIAFDLGVTSKSGRGAGVAGIRLIRRYHRTTVGCRVRLPGTPPCALRTGT
ncbi:hypothetical protein ABIB51_003761 [Arthrobacter sp. UYCu712]